jgi:hypothetical protein
MKQLSIGTIWRVSGDVRQVREVCGMEVRWARLASDRPHQHRSRWVRAEHWLAWARRAEYLGKKR